jgi:hypothetical protein
MESGLEIRVEITLKILRMLPFAVLALSSPLARSFLD